MIKINNIPLPKYPSTFSVTVSDLDDATTTGRTMDGILHRDRIAVKRKLVLSFNALTWSEISQLLNMISAQEFDVEYPDPQEGISVTKKFYVGDRNAPIGVYRNGEPIWLGVSFNFIEL